MRPQSNVPPEKGSTVQQVWERMLDVSQCPQEARGSEKSPRDSYV